MYGPGSVEPVKKERSNIENFMKEADDFWSKDEDTPKVANRFIE